MNNTKPKVLCNRCYGAREVTEPSREFTFMSRIFMSRPKQVACPECSVVTVRAVRKHRSTAQQSITLVQMQCSYREGKAVVAITEGGVTGWESVYFDDHFLDTARVKGWWACAGSTDRYDGLFVPAKEMRAAFERLGLT